MGVTYVGKSDVSDSGKASEASQSPAVPIPSSKGLPNERARNLRHSLLNSNDEYAGEYDYSPSHPTRTPSHEIFDDGASRRHSDDHGNDVGTTLNRDKLKPWSLP